MYIVLCVYRLTKALNSAKTTPSSADPKNMTQNSQDELPSILAAVTSSAPPTGSSLGN